MSNKSRRKLLKSIAAGSGAIVAGKSLPEKWSRPVVDSVILPVHAQTSGDTLCSIAAGCIPIDTDVYISFPGGIEGDFFPAGATIYANSTCLAIIVGRTLNAHAVARTADDAIAIAIANNFAATQASNFFRLAGDCQIWTLTDF